MITALTREVYAMRSASSDPSDKSEYDSVLSGILSGWLRSMLDDIAFTQLTKGLTRHNRRHWLPRIATAHVR
jgi:hypothetical protein